MFHVEHFKLRNTFSGRDCSTWNNQQNLRYRMFHVEQLQRGKTPKMFHVEHFAPAKQPVCREIIQM